MKKRTLMVSTSFARFKHRLLVPRRTRAFRFVPALLTLVAVSACKDERLALCELPPDPGTRPCARRPQFYYVYDSAENACKRQVYTGCGHPYRFLSQKRCERACVAHCGDGHKERSEECDDGNEQSGDGCSAECTLEGTVLVDAGAEVNACPRIQSYSVGPLQAAVGSTITLSAVVVDPEGDPWELSWTASAGAVTVSDPQHAEYQCTVAGEHTLTLSLSGSAECEGEMKQIAVSCVP